MNAFEIPGGQFTLNTITDCERHRFVTVSPDGLALHATAKTDPIVGVSYAAAKATQPLSIVGSGIAMIEAGASVTAGKYVTAGDAGKAVIAESAFDGAGIALTSADAGQLVSVKL